MRQCQEIFFCCILEIIEIGETLDARYWLACYLLEMCLYIINTNFQNRKRELFSNNKVASI